MKRAYLDALIESYIAHMGRGGDTIIEDGRRVFRTMGSAYVAMSEEVERLCALQRKAGVGDYFERRRA